jgi:hypothetical protein
MVPFIKAYHTFLNAHFDWLSVWHIRRKPLKVSTEWVHSSGTIADKSDKNCCSDVGTTAFWDTKVYHDSFTSLSVSLCSVNCSCIAVLLSDTQRSLLHYSRLFQVVSLVNRNFLGFLQGCFIASYNLLTT